MIFNQFLNLKVTNKVLAIKFIDELSKPYTAMRAISRDIEGFMQQFNKNSHPIAYVKSEENIKIIDNWFKYVAFEESNPITLDSKTLLFQRITLAYEQILLIFSKWPEVWLAYINHLLNLIESNEDDDVILVCS